FFQAEDGIRDLTVTGVQTCALPISRAHTARGRRRRGRDPGRPPAWTASGRTPPTGSRRPGEGRWSPNRPAGPAARSGPGSGPRQIGRASCRERVEEADVEGG